MSHCVHQLVIHFVGLLYSYLAENSALLEQQLYCGGGRYLKFKKNICMARHH